MQAGGRRHGPFGPSRIPVVPDGQWRAVPVRVIAPDRRRCAAAVLRWSRRGPAGPVPQVLPSRARVRVPVSRRGCRVTARCAGGQSHRWCEARSPRQQAAWPHGYRGLRHQPDRTARQITMNFVSTRSTTGDVARLADFGEKPPERTKERK